MPLDPGLPNPALMLTDMSDRSAAPSGRGSCERTFGVAMGQFAMSWGQAGGSRAAGGVVCFILNEA